MAKETREHYKNANDYVGIDNKLNEVILNLKLYTTNYDAGASIAVHAPYGCGKTFFATKLEKKINEEEKDFDCIYIDMFENEYQDPMLTFLKQLHTKYKDEANKDLIKKTTRTFIGMLAGVTKKFTGIDDKLITDTVDKLLNTEENPIKEIKNKLTELSKNKKIVFLIDEIDRCNPSFSIEMLERIKHFFDIPNIVFVLFVNPNYVSQIESKFIGYGIENNGYITKFIDKSIFLETDWSKTSFFSTLDYLGNFSNTFYIEIISSYFKLSLRDIKKINKDMKLLFQQNFIKDKSSDIYLIITFLLFCIKLKNTEKFINLYTINDGTYLRKLIDEFNNIIIDDTKKLVLNTALLYTYFSNKDIKLIPNNDKDIFPYYYLSFGSSDTEITKIVISSKNMDNEKREFNKLKKNLDLDKHIEDIYNI